MEVSASSLSRLVSTLPAEPAPTITYSNVSIGLSLTRSLFRRVFFTRTGFDPGSSPRGMLRLRTLCARLLVQLIVQMRFHRRPFGGDDTVNHSIAQRAVWRNLMAAQNAVQLGGQPLDAEAAMVGEEIRGE